MLSMKAKYALKALICMANDNEPHMAAKTISERTGVPHKFLDTILQDLRAGGFIEAKRGIFGGYCLARPASELVIGDVIRRIDGPLAPIKCASLTAYERCEDCADEAACTIRRLMQDVRFALASVLDHRCLSDLLLSSNGVAYLCL